MFFSLSVLYRDEKSILELELELSLFKPGFSSLFANFHDKSLIVATY